MEVASAVVLTLPRVMPGPVPGTHAVPRPDRSRRGPQPIGAPCGTVRRGWPGQARPGRRNHERASLRAGPSRASKASVFPRTVAAWRSLRRSSSRSPASCPGLSRAPTPCRGRTAPGEGRNRSVRPAARSGVGGRDKPGQDGGTMRGRASGGHLETALQGRCDGLPAVQSLLQNFDSRRRGSRSLQRHRRRRGPPPVAALSLPAGDRWTSASAKARRTRSPAPREALARRPDSLQLPDGAGAPRRSLLAR